MSAVSDILQEREVISIHDVREGGIFAALWEMAAAKNVGLSVDFKNIPIRQHTIEVCEYFNLNPYMLRSGGTLLLACANGARIVEQLKNAGVQAAVIGQTTAGNDRLIRYDDEARFLEPSRMNIIKYNYCNINRHCQRCNSNDIILIVTKYKGEKQMRNEILRMLENNSRIDLHDLAIMLGTDESVVLEEIEKMENEGIICGYPTLINWDKTDTEKVTAFIEVRVTPQRGQGFEKLAERITNYPEVKSIYLMSGAFDFAIFLEGKTLKEVSMFVSTKLSTLEAVAGTATHFVLKKYKDHGMILIDKEPANRMKVTP